MSRLAAATARPALGKKELLAGLLVQRQAEALRKLLDLDGEGRRRHMHLLRRPRHVHVTRERGEETQLVKRDLPKHHFMILKRIRLNNELNSNRPSSRKPYPSTSADAPTREDEVP